MDFVDGLMFSLLGLILGVGIYNHTPSPSAPPPPAPWVVDVAPAWSEDHPCTYARYIDGHTEVSWCNFGSR